MAILIYKDEVYKIIGAAMEVYNHLGPGFLEAVYQEALELEFALREIPFVSQVELPIFYKGTRLKKYYIADFLVFDKIVLEIKAINTLTSVEDSQLLNELTATQFELGLLVNFGNFQGLDWKRLAHTKRNKALSTNNRSTNR